MLNNIESNYTITRLQASELHELIHFVVEQNYSHHSSKTNKGAIEEETMSLIEEEQMISSDISLTYVARSLSGQIIGCIRTCRWDRKVTLPMQKIFNINPAEIIESSDDVQFWHVGRFAVDSYCGISPIILFKQLMLFAIIPIVEARDAIMLAEVDNHLMHIVNHLGIITHPLGNPIEYLGSLTTPVYSWASDLNDYYIKYK
ncbi:MAG: hypothetical protein IKX59_08365 [Bacteroidales bacterium]|nr:hypothetical protein [Bacteroidales bacterium]